MQVKILSARKKEILFITGSVLLLFILGLCVFLLVNLVADKATTVYTTTPQHEVNQTKLLIDRYYEVAEKLFPDGAPSIEPDTPVLPSQAATSTPATTTPAEPSSSTQN